MLEIFILRLIKFHFRPFNKFFDCTESCIKMHLAILYAVNGHRMPFRDNSA